MKSRAPSPVPLLPPLLDAALFARIAATYRRQTGLELSAVAPDGRALAGAAARSSERAAPEMAAVRATAVAEARRWGEPSVMNDPRGEALWAVPVVFNQKLLGGLVVEGVPLENRGGPGSLDQRLMTACHRLLALAVEHNLVNQAELAQRRGVAEREREKAEAMHAIKATCFDDMRVIYLREEPALLSAIRRGDRAEARGVINRVLTYVYGIGGNRTELLKSLALELVVMMTRAAVQAGGAPTQILGLNYQSLTALARVDDQEELSAWLCRMLEQLIDALQVNRRHPNSAQLARALDHIEEHLGEPLRREEVARVAGLSPSHFSHLMRAKTGQSFTDVVTRLRIDRAAHLLAHSPRDLARIAADCGFADQSYFTRVFRKCTGRTPGGFRRAQQSATAQKS